MATIAKRKIRYAVVGLGNIAQVAVLPAFVNAENVELVALVSGDADKREAMRRRYEVAHVGDYDHLEQVLKESRADAVYVATPNTEHRVITERAARIGVHVLCEKPMAPTVSDCRAMIDVCKQNRVRLMIAYRLHFDETTLRAIELVRSGKLGELRMFSAVFSQETRPGDIRTRKETGGGAIYDLGVYPINAARYLFEDEPTEVMAMSVDHHDARFDGVAEATVALLRFPGGRTAQLSVSLAASAVSSYRIVGTKGDLRLEPGFGYTSGIKQFVTIDGETKEHREPVRDQFAPELITFAQCILEGREPEASGVEGLADVRVIEAILDAAHTGTVVRLEAFEKGERPTRRQAIVRPAVDAPPTVHAPAPAMK